VLDSIRKRQRWLTAIFVFGISVVFVFFLGLGGNAPSGPTAPSGSTDAIVVLDDTRILVSDYQRIRGTQEQRMQDAMGAQFDAKSLGSFLDSQALQSVVNQTVLSQSALDLGLAVSPDEVKDLLRNDPSLRDAEGKFDQQNFDANVKWTYGSQTNFLNAMQRDLLQQKMYELVVSQTHVSDAEAMSAARYRLEEAQIAFVAIQANLLPEGHQPSDADAAAFLAANQADVQAAYDAEDDRFSSLEQARLRHILFTPDPDGGDDAAIANRAKAEGALARLAAGEDFEALAKELSNDTASKDVGGDLGLITRGDVSLALESVVFDLEVGTVSEIVEGPEGLHIVRVDEKLEAQKESFDTAGLELAKEGAAIESAKALAQSLSDAVAGGQSLEDAARAAELTLERTSFFTRRRDGFIPGLARPSLEVLATAFALTPEAASSKRIFEVGEQLVLIQLLERQAPDPESLEAAVATSKESLLSAQQNALLQAWIDTQREAYEADKRLVINTALVAGS
jgi:peptidyl-prolyl cis-trans isomerase D